MDNCLFVNLTSNEIDNIDGGGLFGLIGGAIIVGVVGAIGVAISGGSKEQIGDVLGACTVAGATYGAYTGLGVSGPF